MTTRLTRRNFLGTTALGAALSMTGSVSSLFADEAAGKSYKTTLYKAFIAGEPTPEACKAHAEAGFNGLEVTNWNATADQIKANRKIAEDYGLRVHSIMRGWANLNAEDEAARKESVESIKTAIRTAALYGADAILLVPCKVGGFEWKEGEPRIPNPKDFQIEFDPATCRVNKVVEGDNAPFADYIHLQNRATELTFQALQDVIPTAAYEGVTVALENVWNNLWVKPEFYAAFVNMFDDLWIKSYFDLGNHAKYADPCDWLRAIGKNNLAKLHIKDFRVDPAKDNTGLDGFVGLGTGTIDWVAVRNAIDEVGYNGWVSYEEGAYSPAEYGRRLDQFFGGVKIG